MAGLKWWMRVVGLLYLLLFVMASLARVPLVSIIREIWPFVLALAAILLLLTLFPSITLFLPRLFGYR